jgi:hypothetical protein
MVAGLLDELVEGIKFGSCAAVYFLRILTF